MLFGRGLYDPVTQRYGQDYECFIHSYRPADEVLCTIADSCRPADDPRILQLIFAGLPLREAYKPCTDAGRRGHAPTRMRLRSTTTYLYAKVQPFIRSISSSHAQHRLLHIQTGGSCRLRNLRTRALTPSLTKRRVENFILQYSMSVVVCLGSCRICRLCFIDNHLVSNGHFHKCHRHTLRYSDAPFMRYARSKTMQI